MDLSKLILDKSLLNIKIGNDINVLDLEVISNQDGDIPALFGCYIGNLYFEVTVIKDIVIGIQFDFTYETEKIYFELDQNIVILSEETELQDLFYFLKNTNLDFTIIESEIEPKRINLNKSNTNFYFSEEERLVKINNFDWNIYEKLTNSN